MPRRQVPGVLINGGRIHFGHLPAWASRRQREFRGDGGDGQGQNERDLRHSPGAARRALGVRRGAAFSDQRSAFSGGTRSRKKVAGRCGWPSPSWRAPSRSTDSVWCARQLSARPASQRNGPGRLLARKRWILREAGFILWPVHKRGGYAPEHPECEPHGMPRRRRRLQVSPTRWTDRQELESSSR
jgi:hypothetical protein